MATPLHRKPPLAAWIVRERRRLGLKPKDIVDRLKAMGLEVSEQTVKVWESNADRRPNPYNIEGLERIFGSAAPVSTSTSPIEQTELLDILRQQSAAILAIAETLTKSPTTDQRVAEMPPAYVGDAGGIDETTANTRRAYWIRRARERLAPAGRKIMSFDELADRLGLTGNARSLPASWQRGTRAVDPAYFERLARALHIPLRDIEFPPETDEERLDRWAREFSEVPPSETERPQTRQRRAS